MNDEELLEALKKLNQEHYIASNISAQTFKRKEDLLEYMCNGNSNTRKNLLHALLRDRIATL